MKKNFIIKLMIAISNDVDIMIAKYEFSNIFMKIYIYE